MCFTLYSDKRTKPRPKKAKQDIIVFKVLKKSGWGCYKPLIINGKKLRWQKGTEVYETTPFKDAEWESSISELNINGNALHSGTLENAKTILSMSKIRKIVKMIIPKGALYYENNEGEYVSNRLVYPNWEI